MHVLKLWIRALQRVASRMVMGGDDVVWIMVRDMAIQHCKIECDEIKESDSACSEPASKRARIPSGSSRLMIDFLQLEKQYRSRKKAGCINQSIPTADCFGGEGILVWNTPGSALAPLLPLVASVAAVPGTEAICELLFKAGGQVPTSARLRRQLLCERVDSLFMCNYNDTRG